MIMMMNNDLTDDLTDDLTWINRRRKTNQSMQT